MNYRGLIHVQIACICALFTKNFIWFWLYSAHDFCLIIAYPQVSLINVHVDVTSEGGELLNFAPWWDTGLQLRGCTIKLFFLFLNRNICCAYSKEPSHWDGSFEHPKHMIKIVDKKILTVLRSKVLLTDELSTKSQVLDHICNGIFIWIPWYIGITTVYVIVFISITEQ